MARLSFRFCQGRGLNREESPERRFERRCHAFGRGQARFLYDIFNPVRDRRVDPLARTSAKYLRFCIQTIYGPSRIRCGDRAVDGMNGLPTTEKLYRQNSENMSEGVADTFKSLAGWLPAPPD